MADTTELSAARAPRLPHLVRTQRTIQVILGLFWILDAALQFQPYMFGQGFVHSFILANASGQPAPIAWFLTHMGHFLSPHVAVWNAFFALIQLCIGTGLLFRRTVRPALVVSFFWALGVWVLGEGLGMLFTGTATALTGAPGSVFIYGCLGLMAWPRRATRATRATETTDQVTADERHTEDLELAGVASSAAGRRVERLLGAGRRAVRASGQPDPDLGVERHCGYGAGDAELLRPLPDQRRQSLQLDRSRDGMGAGHCLPRHRPPALVDATAQRLPLRRGPAGRCPVDHRPGVAGGHLERVGYRPQH